MIQVLQINLNGCQAAQNLALQVARERSADVILVSEQYRNLERNWYSDTTSRAAIYVTDNNRWAIDDVGQGRGWTRIRTKGIRFYSCYFSPNITIDQFAEELGNLGEDILSAMGPIVVAGDFNAQSAEWGSRTTNIRGTMLSEAVSSWHLITANIGRKPTFAARGTTSILDVTFADETTIGRLRNWHVIDDYSHSDHSYVAFEVLTDTRQIPTRQRDRWCVRKLDGTKLRAAFDEHHERFAITGAPNSPLGAEEATRRLQRMLREGCYASMPRCRGEGRQKPKPVYWWNAGIADLRKRCLRAKRLVQRHKHRDRDEVEVWKDLRKQLRVAINDAKANCWNDLCESVNRDPWGLPYRLVRQKLRGRREDPFLEDPANVAEVIRALFPDHREGDLEHSIDRQGYADAPVPDLEPDELFTQAELAQAVKRLKPGKAPGMDGVPNEVLKVLATKYPQIVLETFNACLREGYFHSTWKRQMLILIPKEGKPAGHPSSYRPICLLDAAGKLMERLILQKITPYLEEGENALTGNQYGFRRKRSAIGAVSYVVDRIRGAWRGSVKASRHAMLVTLDVRNAFNSAHRGAILHALRRRFSLPEHLVRIVKAYLQGRKLHYHGLSGEDVVKLLSAGVPQGSVLGPTLWNILYDGLLRLTLPDGAELVAFADDIALLVLGKCIQSIEIIAAEALRRVLRWMDRSLLQLAVEKTEAVLFTRKRALPTPKLVIGGFRVPFKGSLKYLGVNLDAKLIFHQHIVSSSAKAAKTGEQLARLMPNVGGPKPARRKLYSAVVHSILLYGAPVWASCLEVERRRKIPAAVQRKCALAITSAYRTTSRDAVLVLAGIPPIELQAAERQSVFRGVARAEARAQTRSAWQRQWETSTKGRWTYRIVGGLSPWCDRKHGELTFHLTQLLTGHGCFGSYLHRIGKEASPKCHHCAEAHDDVEHTVFACPAWQDQRLALEDSLGGIQLTPEAMVPTMLRDTSCWQAWEGFARSIMSTKEEAERLRQRQPP
jgi:Reverse transcriptase (RNA-dependent DNA polymerase)/Endonuclease-reverse transcriptase